MPTSVDAASKQAANFEAGRPLAALVDGGDEYAAVAGVRILGTMSVVQDPELVDRLQDMVFEKCFHVGHPYAEAYFEFGEWAGRRYYELVPDKLIGWTRARPRCRRCPRPEPCRPTWATAA